MRKTVLLMVLLSFMAGPAWAAKRASCVDGAIADPAALSRGVVVCKKPVVEIKRDNYSCNLNVNLSIPLGKICFPLVKGVSGAFDIDVTKPTVGMGISVKTKTVCTQEFNISGQKSISGTPAIDVGIKNLFPNYGAALRFFTGSDTEQFLDACKVDEAEISRNYNVGSNDVKVCINSKDGVDLGPVAISGSDTRCVTVKPISVFKNQGKLKLPIYLPYLCQLPALPLVSRGADKCATSVDAGLQQVDVRLTN